jgi:hypothetical protein
MASRQGLFVVAVLLFVSGIGFIIAAERTRRSAGPGEPAAAVEQRAAPPVATVRQLMDGLLQPAAESVWNSVSVTVSHEGTVEKEPRTDEEWAAVATGAAMLVESSSLLLQSGRVIDDPDWTKASHDLAAAGTEALKAAEAKDKDGIFKVGETIYRACTDCHDKYLRE